MRHDLHPHATVRPASAQVSSRFRAGFGPASIMDFGFYQPFVLKLLKVGIHRKGVLRLAPASVFVVTAVI